MFSWSWNIPEGKILWQGHEHLTPGQNEKLQQLLTAKELLISKDLL